MTTYVTINGHTYSDGKNDGGSGIRFLANGGHRANFLLLIADIVAVAGGVGGTEVIDNKVTSISGASTDVQYPSAKLLYDQMQLKASLSAVIAQAITGFSAGAGTVSATDTVLQAFNKIVGNIDAINLFKTIAVSGQSNVVADTATDTLTLVAGTNVTITTDAATDSITINASSMAGSETVTSIGALINGATAKTTPVDADMLGLMDSAAGNVLKKLSWLNINATLKTYFDTLYAALAGATFTGAVIHSDTSVSRANFIDCALVTLAKGTVESTSTVTFDYTAGSIQTLTCGGAYTLTWAFSNWPPTGNKGFVEVQATNMGLGTLAFSGTINWKLKNDTYTTTFGTYLTDRGGETVLKESGLDTFLFWTSDAGTTIYGVML